MVSVNGTDRKIVGQRNAHAVVGQARRHRPMGGLSIAALSTLLAALIPLLLSVGAGF